MKPLAERIRDCHESYGFPIALLPHTLLAETAAALDAMPPLIAAAKEACVVLVIALNVITKSEPMTDEFFRRVVSYGIGRDFGARLQAAIEAVEGEL